MRCGKHIMPEDGAERFVLYDVAGGITIFWLLAPRSWLLAPGTSAAQGRNLVAALGRAGGFVPFVLRIVSVRQKSLTLS